MNPNSHEEPTEQELNAMGIYKGNPDWANKFNVTRRIAQLLKESQTPPSNPKNDTSREIPTTCVPEREENLSGQLERHRDTLQEKPKLEKCNAYIIIAGTKCGIEAYTKESVDKLIEWYEARK